MIKQKECVVLVSSIQDVIKFYTDKLGFDIIDLIVEEGELHKVHLRKGKCFLTFKRPSIQESVEYSFIKGCPSRCLTMSIEVSKDLDKMLAKYEKKGVAIASKTTDADMLTSFTIKDGFGLRLHFFQDIEENAPKESSETNEFTIKSSRSNQDRLISKAVEKLQSYGVVRKAAKKYCKAQLKAKSR